jgi:type I restriction enzyme, S subunit
MKTMTISSSWTDLNERRLDGRPYHSGSTESRVLLKELPVKKNKLIDITKDNNGIFNGPRFARKYVENPDYGVPFLGSTDILLSDLSMLPFLSKSYVADHPNLLIDNGWTLITCSGTIGRMAFARPEMKNMAGSQHFMRVVPDTNKTKPGYLFSFLSSRFGLPMVIGMTYGAIIQHIEPHHIADLPVPELGDVEEKSHQLCVLAAEMRTEASKLLVQAGEIINTEFGFPSKIAFSNRNYSITRTTSLHAKSRLEATYHDWVAQKSDELLNQVKSLGILAKVADLGETGRIKQIFTNEKYGVPFLTSGDLFLLRLAPDRFLSKRLLPEDERWKIEEGDILMARSGQVGGIIGHSVWADKRFESLCVSVDVLHIRAIKGKIPAGYLFAYLNLTDVGYRQLVRAAAGSSIPHISPDDVALLRVPRTDDATEERVSKLVFKAGQFRARAQEKEDEARLLVEKTIEELARHG